VRRAWVGICVTVIVVASGCGGGDMSMSEYVDEMNTIGARIAQQSEVVVAEAGQIAMPSDVNAMMERVQPLRMEVLEAFEGLDPPEEVADLHRLLSDWMAKIMLAEEALATRALTVASWEEFSQSSEMAAYRAVLVEGKQGCTDFQAKLDATAARGVFADTPWIPGDLKEVVDAALGCKSFPENPEAVYRQPPAASAP
jgi:hypothetical protein